MYENIVESLKKSAVVEKGGYHYFVHPLTNGIPACDPRMIEDITDWMISVGNLNCDLILAPESMGIPYAVMLSAKTGIPYCIIRKISFGFEKEIEITQRTGYSKSSMYIYGVTEGKRVAIVDDVISTAGTMNAIVSAVKMAGAVITDILVPVNKDGGASRAAEYGISVKTLFNIDATPDGVSVSLSSEQSSDESDS